MDLKRIRTNFKPVEQIDQHSFKVVHRKTQDAFFLQVFPRSHSEAKFSLFEIVLAFSGLDVAECILPLREVVCEENMLVFLYDYRPFRLNDFIVTDVLTEDQQHFILFSVLQVIKAISSLGLVVSSLHPCKIHLNETCGVALSGLNDLKASGEPIKEIEGRLLSHYESPEVLLSGNISPSSDLWSFGIIFLEMMLKKVVLRPRSFLDVLQFHLSFWDDFDEKTLEKMKVPQNIQSLCLNVSINFKSPFNLKKKLISEVGNSECREIISRLLEFDPERRITLEELLYYPMFRKQVTQDYELGDKEILLSSIRTILSEQVQNFEEFFVRDPNDPDENETELELCHIPFDDFILFLDTIQSKTVLKKKNVYVYIREFFKYYFK